MSAADCMNRLAPALTALGVMATGVHTGLSKLKAKATAKHGLTIMGDLEIAEWIDGIVNNEKRTTQEPPASTVRKESTPGDRKTVRCPSIRFLVCSVSRLRSRVWGLESRATDFGSGVVI